MSPPRRIVSLVPSQTELLADLGLDDEVMGITKFCVHPADWRARKTIVGGTKRVWLDRVVELAPDLVVANKEENTKADVDALRALAPCHVTDVADLPDALAMVTELGALTDRAEAARALADRIADGFAALPDFAPLRVAYLIWQDPFMTVGGDTFIGDMLRRAGLVNHFEEARRYPEVDLDALRGLDAVLLSSEPFPFGAEHVAELSARLPGVKVVRVDGELFSWYGSRLLRTPACLRALRAALDAA